MWLCGARRGERFRVCALRRATTLVVSIAPIGKNDITPQVGGAGVALLGVQALQRALDAREVVFESEPITVWCYPKLRIVHHEMSTSCYGTPFRQALLAGTKAMKQHGAIGWLSDDRRNGPLSDEDERWGTTIWFQQTKAAGWKYWAMVVPEKAVGKLSVKRFVEMYRKRGIEAQMFTEPVAAMAWLQTQISDGAAELDP